MKNYKHIAIVIILFMAGLSAKSQITEIGLASFYADKFDGRVTASGDIFDQNKMTAAHRTFPFGTKVKVTNINNKKVVTVVINDRGPFIKDRVIDLSKLAAKKLGFISEGVTRVKVEVISLGKTIQQNYSNKKPAKTSTSYHKQNKAKTHTVAKTSVAINANQGAIAKSALEYYKIESNLITPKGYGIQVASYQEAANLIKRCDVIKKGINKDIIIQVGENKGSKVYRIIIGTFTTREAAVSYNKKLGNRFNGSFVIAF